MNYILRVVMPLAVLSLSTQALSAPPDSVTGPPPISVDTFVINDVSSPVPVSGDVNANVSGDVEVTGAVDVTSVPESLTEQIDTLIEKVDKLSEAENGPQAEPISLVKTYDLSAESGESDEIGLGAGGDSAQVVSTLIISTENDKGIFYFDCISDVNVCGRGTIGQPDADFPHVLTVSFPKPVPMQLIRWECTNDQEPCEVAVTIIGFLGTTP